MRADRLLSILLLLQTRRSMTSSELADRLGVSVRTVHRDMQALEVAGVPITTRRGPGGGWALVDGYRTNLTGLDHDEVVALFLRGPETALSDLGLREAADRALLKVLAALSEGRRARVETAHQRFLIEPSGAREIDDRETAFLEELQQAVWESRKLAFDYRRSDGEAISRTVDALGLVLRGRAWYLVAGSGGELRTYRASRVTAARVLEERAEVPEGFDLRRHWQESWREFRAHLPRYPVLLRVAPAALDRARRPQPWATLEEELSPDAEGWIPVRIRFETLPEARDFVLRLGPLAEVVTPLALRHAVIESLTATASLYASGEPS